MIQKGSFVLDHSFQGGKDSVAVCFQRFARKHLRSSRSLSLQHAIHFQNHLTVGQVGHMPSRPEPEGLGWNFCNLRSRSGKFDVQRFGIKQSLSDRSSNQCFIAIEKPSKTVSDVRVTTDAAAVVTEYASQAIETSNRA